MSTIDAQFIQQTFFHVFQPIHALPGRTPLGHEALIRSHSPVPVDRIFREAARRRVLFELDTQSVLHAMSLYWSAADRRDAEALLFLNIFPSTLTDAAFPAFLDGVMREYGAYAGRTVFEINESLSEKADWDDGSFIRHLELLRRSGFAIAFDDVGEGATTLKRIVELSPEYIKMDRFFGKQLAGNRNKQKIVKFFVEYCAGESKLILEGIEEPEDLSKAQSLGVTLAQGYLLSRPGELPGAPRMEFRLNDS